jgi:hypothetical protein
LEDDLASHVAQIAALSGLALEVTPSVYILSRPGLSRRDVLVEARYLPPGAQLVESTREMQAQRDGEGTMSPPVTGQPFLIVDGRRTVDLSRAVVTIGRGLDNDVILEDPRVSRKHAQLRLRYDRYVLYDIGSRGGTEVNGYPVTECALQAGDVVSFSGVQVVYGEDRSAPGCPGNVGDTPVLLPGDALPA